ncbi:MAG: TRAP transporter small permease [Bacteroidetes bacterium]|nr:TRAP transporter small permease [Bacteroidota bacterium]MCY4204093.1 TRAP transporter small permease [Bacteroidota bacterium]
MTQTRHLLDRFLSVFVATLMATLVLDVLWQVFTRFILGNPSSWTEELARYLMIWVGLIGAAYAAGRRMHLSVDLLPNALSGNRATTLRIVIESFVLLFAVTALFAGGIRLVWVMLTLGQTSASLQLPLGYVYLAVPLSGLFIAWYAILDLVDEIKNLKNGNR